MNLKTETVTVTLTPAIRTAESRFNAKKGEASEKARPKLTWTYAGFEETGSHARAVNVALEDFGKRLIVKNATDWGFSPTPDNCNLAALIADLDAERAGWTRTLTKETLEAAANYYKDAAVRILGKTAASGEAGATLITKKCAQCAGNPKMAEIFAGNIVEILESETELSRLEPHTAVFQKLLEILAEMQQAEELTPDAL